MVERRNRARRGWTRTGDAPRHVPNPPTYQPTTRLAEQTAGGFAERLRKAADTVSYWTMRMTAQLPTRRIRGAVLRVGIDIDGVIASDAWERPPWTIVNGWEQSEVLDAEGLATAVERTRSGAWETYAITARPAGPGRTVQRQTQRWLQEHDAGELSVIVDPGNRARIARALALDWLIDDHLEHCCCTALETDAQAVWIHPHPDAEPLRQARANGCHHATMLSGALTRIDTA